MMMGSIRCPGRFGPRRTVEVEITIGASEPDDNGAGLNAEDDAGFEDTAVKAELGRGPTRDHQTNSEATPRVRPVRSTAAPSNAVAIPSPRGASHTQLQEAGSLVAEKLLKLRLHSRNWPANSPVKRVEKLVFIQK